MSDNFNFTHLRNFYKQQLKNQDRIIAEHLKQAYQLMRESVQQSNETFLQLKGDTPNNRRLISDAQVEVEAARLCRDMLSDVSTANDVSNASDGDDECEEDDNANVGTGAAAQGAVKKSRSRKRRRPQLVRSPYPERERLPALSFQSPLEQIPVKRRERWYRKPYPKPTNLLSEIEQAAHEPSSSSSSEAGEMASSASDVRPVGLNRSQHIADDDNKSVFSSSSSSALEINPNVSIDGGNDDMCDREVRDILNMSTLEAVAGSTQSELEDGQIISSDGGEERDDDDGGHDVHDGGDDSRYDLDSPPFHMIDRDDDTILSDLPYVLFCGRCDAPNSIRHIYTKFDQQREAERLEAEATAEAARRHQEQHQQVEVEIYDIPPTYSQLFQTTMPAPSTPPTVSATPTVPQNSPVAASTPVTPEALAMALNYAEVAPPGAYDPLPGGSNAYPHLFMSPGDHYGTPSNNRTAECFLQDDVQAGGKHDKEEGELSSSSNDEA